MKFGFQIIFRKVRVSCYGTDEPYLLLKGLLVKELFFLGNIRKVFMTK